MWFTTSWDDGHPLDERLAELMARWGIAGTFFCPISNLEGLPVMSSQALRRLDGGLFEIGSHTLSHTYANAVDPGGWRQEVIAGKHALEDTLGHPIHGFCYPGGKRRPGSATVVRAAGFRYARTSVNFCVDPGNDRFSVPTTLQFYPHTPTVLARNLVSRGRWLHRLPLALAALRRVDLIDRLHAMMPLADGPGAVFHLWGHSWEIDRQGLWHTLESFFSEVSKSIPSERRVTNFQWLQAATEAP